jgi:hypothetical protein
VRPGPVVTWLAAASVAAPAAAQLAQADVFWHSSHPEVLTVVADAGQLAQETFAERAASWSVRWVDIATKTVQSPRVPRRVEVKAADGTVDLYLDAPIEPWNDAEQLLDVVVTYFHPQGYTDLPLRRRAPSAATGGAAAPPAGGYVAARGHADADVYLSGSLIASRTSRPAYSGDVKLNYRWLGWNSASLRAGVELNAASEANIDPDSFRASLSYRRPLRSPGRAGRRPDLILVWNALGLEWGRQRDLVNLASSARLTWVPPSWGPARRVFVAAEPFLGLDLGRSLSGLDPAAENSIVRPALGANLSLLALRPAQVLDRVTLSAEYALRLPRTDEPFSRLRGGVIETTLTRRARPYLRVDLALQLEPGYGVTLKYEDGSLPPAFARVEGRFSLGVSVQLARSLQ